MYIHTPQFDTIAWLKQFQNHLLSFVVSQSDFIMVIFSELSVTTA